MARHNIRDERGRFARRRRSWLRFWIVDDPPPRFELVLT